jgi:intron-binding protein aquarius
VQEVFPAFFARVLALRLPDSQKVLAQHEQTAYLLFMINAFQSLEDEMVRAQVGFSVCGCCIGWGDLPCIP